MIKTANGKLTHEVIDKWATDAGGPVALHLRQLLTPVEGKANGGAILFPPTYAGLSGKDSGYNIDVVGDQRVAIIDSVGSQANRMEPAFASEPLRSLVPQVEVQNVGETPVSIFEVGHRLGDALFRSTDLARDVAEAFAALPSNAAPLARLAPTSLVFGVWDSRGSQAKVPRLLQSVIRAWDVYPLTRSAQYEPPIDYSKLEVFSEEEKSKAEGNAKSLLAQRGFVHVPASAAPGGIVARGPIERDVTINLIALRRIAASSPAEAQNLRRYLLGLVLAAGTQPLEGYLRQGCLLVPEDGNNPVWHVVDRAGRREPVPLSEEVALEYAAAAARAFGVGPNRRAVFDRQLAKRDLEEGGEKSGKKKKSVKVTVDG